MIEISIKAGARGAYGDLAASFEAPSLRGSEKQVDWANKIRAEAIEDAFREQVGSPARVKIWNENPELAAQFKAQIQHVLDRATSAKEWIDCRGRLCMQAMAQKHK
jgi:hypothetical protein